MLIVGAGVPHEVRELAPRAVHAEGSRRGVEGATLGDFVLAIDVGLLEQLGRAVGKGTLVAEAAFVQLPVAADLRALLQLEVGRR